MPTISIILPCYNVEKYIERCVKSIQNQTFTDFEALFINDGSTDGIIDTFRNLELDSRFKIFSKENQGSGYARNYGLMKASGNNVYFMDPDDEVEPNFLEDCLKYFRTNNYDLLIFGHKQINIKTKKIKIFSSNELRILDNKDIFREKILDVSRNNSLFAVWNKIFKRNFLIDNELLFSNLPIGQDAEFMWRFYRLTNSAIIVPKPYYIYYTNRPGSARTEYNANQFDSELKILGTIEETLGNWKENKVHQYFINNYKVSIVFQEILNLNKIKLSTYESIKQHSLFQNVKRMKYSELEYRNDKIKLFLIKNNLLFLTKILKR